MRAFWLAAFSALSFVNAGLFRGNNNMFRTLSTNDEAHNITKNVQICKKKEETDCGIWNSVFHETAFDCAEYTFGAAYDVCKGLERHDYCGCADDSELHEWVDKFLDERRRKNWVRYRARPYPAPRQEGSSFLEFALCLKDDDPKGLLCRECEYWNLKHMVVTCNVSNAIELYCGCGEPAIGEYYDALVKTKTTVQLQNQQKEIQGRPKAADKAAAPAPKMPTPVETEAEKTSDEGAGIQDDFNCAGPGCASSSSSSSSGDDDDDDDDDDVMS